MTREDEIERVHGNGTHVVILGAGASIASTCKNKEKNGKILPMMNNIVQIVGLERIVEKLPDGLKIHLNDFEKLYSKLFDDVKFESIRKKIEIRIYDYFKSMELPETPTIYDYLIFSLRHKDVIATFNWDPFLFQAYNRVGKYVKPPGILFLHGNTAIGYNEEEERAGPAGWNYKKTGGFYKPTQLLYPVEKKDYNSNKFIKGQWDCITKKLRIAEQVTVFGYRAPESDIEAITLLQNSWGTPDDRPMEQFELINIKNEQEVKKSWEGFIHSHHYFYSNSFFESSIANHPRRTIESYRNWSQPVQFLDNFQDGNKVPDDFKSLDEMHEWYEPLLKAEEEFIKNKNSS